MIVAMLPAYNEAQALPNLVPKLSDALEKLSPDFRIVVCNDGSTDGSSEVLADLRQRFPLDVIEHRYNRGLGESVRDLIEHGGPALAALREVKPPDTSQMPAPNDMQRRLKLDRLSKKQTVHVGYRGWGMDERPHAVHAASRTYVFRSVGRFEADGLDALICDWNFLKWPSTGTAICLKVKRISLLAGTRVLWPAASVLMPTACTSFSLAWRAHSAGVWNNGPMSTS